MQGLIAYYVKMTFFHYCCNQIGNFCVKSNGFANLKQLFVCVVDKSASPFLLSTA